MLTRVFTIAALSLAIGGVFAQPGSFIAAPFVDQPPTVDGAVSPGEWDMAAATTGFRDNASGALARAQVTVYLCGDAQGIYCLYDARGEDPSDLTAEPQARDSAIWSGSLCELFIAPREWPLHRYAHFMFNYAGTVADELAENGATNLDWNPDWFHAASKTGTGWIAEIMIPWTVLEVSGRQPGDVFRVNFARNASTVDELSTWAPVVGGFHHPEQFGTLALSGEPGARLEAVPPRATGKATITTELTAPSPAAYMSVALAAGQPELRVSRSLNYDETSGRARAAMELRVPNGARALDVRVFNGPGHLLLSQTLNLDLPDITALAREVNAELSAIKTGDSPQVAAQVETLQADLLQLELAADAPRDVAGLLALRDEINGIRRQGRDLTLLADTAEMVRGTPDGDQAPTYFVTNPPTTLKVQPNAPDPGPLAQTVHIAMAQGEYEAAQIAVCAVNQDLEGVSVSVGRLHGPDRSDLGRDRIEVNPLGFVNCQKHTGGATLSGMVPEVLLPDREVDIPAGTRRPFFITVRSEPGDAPGEYRGYLRVRPDNAPSRRIELRVRIYDVEIPVKSHLRSAFVLWGHMRNFNEYASNDEYLDAYIRYAKFMLQHRLSPITMWPPKKTESGEWDFRDFDRYLSELVPLGLTTVNIGGNGTVATTQNVDYAVAAEEHFRQKGWWDLHYVYGRDEAPQSMTTSLQEWYGPLVQAVPSLKIMQTGWSPNPELHGYVKIWCPLTAGAQMEAIRDAQAHGEECWWYVCCGPLAPFANLFVDYPGVDHRILGWQTFQHGIQGFLYWGVDVWTHNYDKPIADFDEADYANWDPNSFSTINGDGYLLYPGPDDTPLASQRLALLRDGFEDYDLFTEAARLADEEGSAALRDLLNFDDLTPKLTQFPTDGNVLMSRREAILQAAEDLARN